MKSLWNFASAFNAKRTCQKRFPHVNCDDEHLLEEYYSSAAVAHKRIDELHLRSWEYQHEFIKSMEAMSREASITHQDNNIVAANKDWYILQLDSIFHGKLISVG